MAKTRAQELGRYIIKNRATIRATAKAFDMAKSTVHVDVSKKLKKENYFLYLRVKKILGKNFEEKHIRGGEATKKFWEQKNRI